MRFIVNEKEGNQTLLFFSLIGQALGLRQNLSREGVLSSVRLRSEHSLLMLSSSLLSYLMLTTLL